MNIPAEVFRAYDIRGAAGKTLTAALVREIGRAIGTVGRERGAPTFAVGRDGRLSSPELAAALMDGLNAAGADVIEIGIVPTPVTYFAAYHLGCHSAVMVTGSHNPKGDNGLKTVIGGSTLSGDQIQDLRKRVESGRHQSGAGRRSTAEVLDAYVDRIVGDVKLARRFKVAIDSGNGMGGVIAPRLFRRLGCDVTELYSEVDGNFPNHHPDPSKLENLKDLISVLQHKDPEIGLAFDGDADRLGVVTKTGQIVLPDRQLMLYARDVLSRNPGAEIVYDVKCSALLAPWIEKHGGKPVVWKTGHSFIKAKLKESGAPLAGEMSGHLFFKERWYGFDDAIYAGARLLEILSREKDASAALEALPNAPSTPELNWKLAEGEPHSMIETLSRQVAAKNPFAGTRRILTIDGIRAEYADGFGLARASNTTPVIVLRFEGKDDAALRRIQEDFRKVLQPLKPGAPLPF